MTDLHQAFPGLIWAFHFAPDGNSVSSLDGEASLPENLPTDGCVWLHLAVPDGRIEAQIARLPGLDGRIAAAVVSRDRHLILSVMGGVLTGTMPGFLNDLTDEIREVGHFHFALTDRLLVTARRLPLQTMSAIRTEVASGRWFAQTIDLFAAVSASFERDLEEHLDRLTDEMDGIEEEIHEQRRGDQHGQLGSLRREIARIHRTLRTSARLFHRMDSRPEPTLPAPARAMLEQRGHHMAALDQDVILLQERARLLTDEISTRRQDQINQNLFILSLFTVVLMPPTLITGFFGMNTKDMFLQDVPGGTVYAAILVIASAALAGWLTLRHFGARRS
ncbi:MAG: CorA family divalent cation transporter [Ancalomicrobiaceae bacterium]|nr:CorA family divalent cation transporter [Ancalomicrobiaceae bacterium]